MKKILLTVFLSMLLIGVVSAESAANPSNSWLYHKCLELTSGEMEPVTDQDIIAKTTQLTTAERQRLALSSDRCQYGSQQTKEFVRASLNGEFPTSQVSHEELKRSQIRKKYTSYAEAYKACLNDRAGGKVIYSEVKINNKQLWRTLAEEKSQTSCKIGDYSTYGHNQDTEDLSNEKMMDDSEYNMDYDAMMHDSDMMDKEDSESMKMDEESMATDDFEELSASSTSSNDFRNPSAVTRNAGSSVVIIPDGEDEEDLREVKPLFDSLEDDGFDRLDAVSNKKEEVVPNTDLCDGTERSTKCQVDFITKWRNREQPKNDVPKGTFSEIKKQLEEKYGENVFMNQQEE